MHGWMPSQLEKQLITRECHSKLKVLKTSRPRNVMHVNHIPMLVGGGVLVVASVLLFVFPRQIAEFFRRWFAANMTSRDSIFSRRSSPGSIVLVGIFWLILGFSLVVRALN